MKFVHAADLHIDSPLRGLEAYPGAPVERVRLASRAALENVIRLCLDEQVGFLVISGDLFDGNSTDCDAPIFVATQFQKLAREKIPVFIIRGNHDSREEMIRNAPWPKNVTLFDHRHPQTISLDRLEVALHGMSFPKREVKENLVPRYPNPLKDMFNIGILHTNATGCAEHHSYAPCGLDDLALKGYDYWALGHVHQYDVLETSPYVVYSGTTQGRHIRESGEKGCVLVSVDDGRVANLEFRSTDVLRWQTANIELQGGDGLDDLYDLARVELRGAAASAEGRLVGVRLRFHGNCAAHHALAKEVTRQEAIDQLRSLPGELADDAWIEKILIDTNPTIDRDKLSEGQDLIGDLLRSVDSIAGDRDRLPDHFRATLKPLAKKVAKKVSLDGIDFDNPEKLAHWLRDAERILLSHLTESAE